MKSVDEAVREAISRIPEGSESPVPVLVETDARGNATAFLPHEMSWRQLIRADAEFRHELERRDVRLPHGAGCRRRTMN